MTIIEFLEARLAEDENVAQEATNDQSQGRWEFDDGQARARAESDRRGVSVCVHSGVRGPRFVLDSSVERHRP